MLYLYHKSFFFLVNRISQILMLRKDGTEMVSQLKTCRNPETQNILPGKSTKYKVGIVDFIIRRNLHDLQ